MVQKHEGIEKAGAGHKPTPQISPSKPKDPKNAIVEALLELAGERNWDDITISDVATRANVSLSAFRDLFPSKGAVLASFSEISTRKFSTRSATISSANQPKSAYLTC